MATATVIVSASPLEAPRVLFAAEEDEGGVEGEEGTEGTGAEGEAEEEATPPNPILPVGKEILWGFGSFLVLLALVRYWLFPAVKKGMDARAARIRSDLTTAEQTTAQAEAEVAEYEAQLHHIRAEANVALETARAQLDGERQARMAEVSAGISERRARAVEEADAARRAAFGQITDAVADVASAAAGRVLGRPVDPARVRQVADEVVGASAGAGAGAASGNGGGAR